MPLDGRELGRAYEKNELVGWSEFIYPGSVKAAWSQIGNTFCSPPIFNDYEKYKDNEVGLHTIVKKVLGNFTPNYAQQIGDPFVVGTKVLMADGTEQNIENIIIGDEVINHKGEVARVSNVIKKNFTGDLVTIKVKGWHKELTATETHHGMILPYKGYRFNYSGVERCKFGEMSVGDYVLIPYGLQKKDSIVLDVNEYVHCDKHDDKFVYLNKQKLPRFIAVNENFARFVGLFLAEGSVEKTAVTFSFNSNETFYMDELKILGKEIFDLDGKIWKTGVESCRRVAFNSKILRNLMARITGSHCHHKYIADFFFRTQKTVKLALLKGWLDGDGHKNFEDNTVIGYTSSDRLGDDMARLSVSCGLNTRSWTRLRKKRARKKNTEIGFYSTEPYKIYPEQAAQVIMKPKVITQNDTPYGFARPIKEIRYEHVEDREVYCITTENEFTAIFNGIAQYQCVSFGAKNATEYLACCDILLRKDAEQFKPVYPPFYYGSSRVLIGGWEGSRSDGSLGSYMAKAVEKYGTLFSDEPNVPKYSGAVAKEWGARGALLKPWLPTTQKYLVKSAALVSTWEELVVAIANGYPCTVASSIGFSMEASSDGFHRQTTQWNHQMMIYFAGNSYKNGEEPYALILNSWADAHGRLKDFVTGEELPIGTLRVRRKDIEKMLRANETFAFSQYDGFPGQKQKIEKALFKLF